MHPCRLPLFDPRQQFQQTGEQRDEAFGCVTALLVADRKS